MDAGSERSDFIDDLIMDYTAGLLSLPDTSVAERWLGHYAHLPGTERLHLTPIENVTLTTMTNGQGMTHAFAIASDVISDLNA